MSINSFTIFSSLIPVFLLIFIGYIWRCVSRIDDRFISYLNTFLFNAAVPALLFVKIANAKFELFTEIKLALSLCIAILIMFFFSLFLVKLLKIKKTIGSVIVQGSFRCNLIYFGFPVIYTMFGDKGLVHASIITAFAGPLINILGIITFVNMLPGKNRRNLFIPQLKAAATNPIVLACIFGIVFSLLSVSLPKEVNFSLNMLGAVALPMSLITMGAIFSFKKLHSSQPQYLFLNGILKLFILPLITLLLLLLLHISSDLSVICLVLAGAPSSPGSFIVAKAMGGDDVFSAATVMSTMLFTIISLPLILSLL
ncbi:MAG: AEC family transporter [Desulfurellaceae bacterium]|nr:AEC family transporter [Desulfurellaceae bacterium]